MVAISFTDALVYGSNIAWIVLIVFIFAYNQRLQIFLSLRSVNKSLVKIESWNKEAKDKFFSLLKERGASDALLKTEANAMVNTFVIEPVNMDPKGIISKIDNVVHNYEEFFKAKIRKMLPAVNEVDLYNLSDVAEASLVLNEIYKQIRHYYLSAKKYHDYYSLVLLQMQMPMIMEVAEAYYGAIPALSKGTSIGDAVGPLVITQLAGGAEFKPIVKETVVAESTVEERKAILIKAKGPGGTVGRPGEAIKKAVESYNINYIITVDAGLKLEGENSGQTIEGYGVAIGGPGTDKFFVEESATARKIPMYVVIIKMSEKEAIGEMTDAVRRASLDAINKVKMIVRERTSKDDVVLIAGIGNTMGIS
ncbi:MAG: DUF1512 domain-containing protein [Nitrososphaerota archaeon]|nr:DUF1512 domain-containing protein [Nitrososphaerota archaeon]MDG7047572.1 DUF1512 domain-containing protein [Nitrososphaerota archaeon]MDG7052013.1 DUF1512 domain-containing protein [Nitrososphaerota archaeon]